MDKNVLFCFKIGWTYCNYMTKKKFHVYSTWYTNLWARYQCGLKHGLERKFHGTYSDAKVLQRLAFYCNDSISGTVWQFLAGGAILVGQVDRETELFSGRDVIYIYPDLFTTIIGRYDNGILVSGFMCNIKVSLYTGQLPICSSWSHLLDRFLDIQKNIRF